MTGIGRSPGSQGAPDSAAGAAATNPLDAAAASTAAAGPATAGRLVLVPNTLDLGAEAQELAAVLPASVLEWAARLRHWIVEDAKSARAFLKRVDAVVPLQAPLQALSIVELPRPPKGDAVRAVAAGDHPGHRVRDSAPDRHGPRGTPPKGTSAGASDPAQWLAPALAGHDVGLLSEAGLPAVADPGASVVKAAHARGIAVLPLAGPSSLMLALAASGLDGQSFAFVGYLPQEAGARAERIRELEGLSRRLRQTQIFIETPYRNRALLAALLACASPATRLSVSVGLTLPNGWSRTTTVAQWRRGLAAGQSTGKKAERAETAAMPEMPDRLPAVFLLQA